MLGVAQRGSIDPTFEILRMLLLKGGIEKAISYTISFLWGNGEGNTMAVILEVTAQCTN